MLRRVPSLPAAQNFYPKSIAYALRCDSARSTKLYRTYGTPTNANVWTFSLWCKRSSLSRCAIFASNASNALFFFDTDYTFYIYSGGAVRSTAFFRDCSSYGHLVIKCTGSATTVYWNNVAVISYAGGQSGFNTASTVYAWGCHYADNSNYYDGYLSDVYFIDGQALDPSNFAQAAALAPNVWVPKAYTGTYGNNGYHLEFGNASALGTDTSGNGNTFTSSGFTSADQFADTPTNNHCIVNAVDMGSNALTTQMGGLRPLLADYGGWRSNLAFSSGKWYWEFKAEVLGGSWYPQIGVAKTSAAIPTAGNVWGSAATGAIVICNDGRILEDTSNPRTLTSFTTNDVLAVAYDADNGALYIGKISGGTTTWMNSGVPTSGASKTGAASTFFSAGEFLAPCGGGGYAGSTGLLNFGATSFAGTPPTGYKTLCTANLVVDVYDSTEAVDSKLYTGTGSAQNITSYAFQPDLVIDKDSTSANSWHWADSVRGITNILQSDTTGAQIADATRISGVLSNGFSVGTHGAVNTNGNAYKSFCAKKLAKYGLDIVTYTGNATNRTIAHSLGKVPRAIIVKAYSTTGGWAMYHVGKGAGYYLTITSGGPTSDAAAWNNTAPTSSVFSLGTSSATNANGVSYVAYLLTDIPGLLKIDTFNCNASAEGPAVNLGFSPCAITFHNMVASGTAWPWWTNAQYPTNPNAGSPNNLDLASASVSTTAQGPFDLLSNGFKIRSDAGWVNNSTDLVGYIAWARAPFPWANAR